jgi:hypothetical protein
MPSSLRVIEGRLSANPRGNAVGIEHRLLDEYESLRVRFAPRLDCFATHGERDPSFG